MEKVLNKELQPIPLDDGTVLPAAGTREAGPREVTLSDKDRRLYVDRGRIALLKPANQGGAGTTPPPPTPPPPTQQVVDNSGRKVGK